MLKAILADALGIHLDGYPADQRGAGLLSVIRYTELRPIVERINDTGDLEALRPPPPADSPTDESDESDATPGGVTR